MTSKNNIAAKPARVLTINGGSASIKFALFETGEMLRRILARRIEGIGFPQGRFAVKPRAKRIVSHDQSLRRTTQQA